MNITTETVLITPELAEQYLEKNGVNRNISAVRVSAYSSDISAGRWKFNPAPITFSVSGKLLDGQHRLHAIIRAGIAVEMQVTRGVPDESMDVIDSGKARTPGDVLKIEGVKESNNAAAIAKMILAHRAGFRSIMSDGAAAGLSGSTRIEVLEFVRANLHMIDDLVSRARIIYEAGRIRLLKLSEIAFFLHTLEPEEKADEFMSKVIGGIGLNEHTPELALRRILERVRFHQQLPVTSAELTQYIQVAFRKYVKGEPCDVLRIQKTKPAALSNKQQTEIS